MPMGGPSSQSLGEASTIQGLIHQPASAKPTARETLRRFLRGRFVVYCPMQTPEITAYLKTYCGWSAGVRAILAKYNLSYTEKDIIQNPAFRWEMETKSGQPLSPCVEVNGKMLADVSGEEVEKYLIDNNIVQVSDATTDVPTNAPCATEQHESEVKLRF